MSEKEVKYSNILNIGKILKGGSLDSLYKKLQEAEKNAGTIVKHISEKEKEINAANQLARELAAEAEREMKLAAREQARAERQDIDMDSADTVGKKIADSEPPIAAPAEKEIISSEKTVEKTPAMTVESEKTADDPTQKESVKTDVAEKVEPSEEKASTDSQESDGARQYVPTDTNGERRQYTPRDSSGAQRQYTPRDSSGAQRQYTPRDTSGAQRQYTPRDNSGAQRQYTPRDSSGAQRQYTPRDNSGAQRQYTPRDSSGAPRQYTPRDNSGGAQRQYTPRDSSGAPRQYTPRDSSGAPRQYTPRDSSGAPRQYTPSGNSGGTYNSSGTGAARQAPPVTSRESVKSFGNKKKTPEKSFDDKKNTVSKRALIKSIDVSDFDENKSGYRKLRVKKQPKKQQDSFIKIEKAVLNSEVVPLKVLSEKLGISAVQITKMLFKENIIKTINDTVDFEIAENIALELGIELELKVEKTAEEVMIESHDSLDEEHENLKPRPPVVTVMGHVDHGKTSLLDRIKNTNITTGEAGGITQHIGAYSVSLKGKSITFIDTPGHAAFTSMRARGAQVTDIAVLVVAADDGIMPQTVEAISHAKAADVSIIVAVNKIDKPTANIEKIKQQLTDNHLVPEEWGGDVIVCPVSAKTGEGIENLLENINLLAELKELKANPDKKARGIIIEAQLDRGKGPVASVLIQSGTLKTGDSIISGTTTGRVRAMIDHRGKNVKSAGPSMAVSVLGLEEVPSAGDTIIAVEQEKLLKSVADERKSKERESMIKSQTRVTLDDVFGKIAEGNMKMLNIVLKADVQGSVEAVKQSISKLSNEEVKVNIIHAQAGAINDSDVMLADSSSAIILGFNVRAEAKSKQNAERSGVDIRTYRIIYELIDDIEAALKGMLTPKYRETLTGKCEVREVFKITGSGMVAGCYVLDGKILRSGKLRIYRDDIMIVENNVNQLKRFKDDVKEVAAGYECGLSIENFSDIKIGDIIECYLVEQIKV